MLPKGSEEPRGWAIRKGEDKHTGAAAVLCMYSQFTAKAHKIKQILNV